MESMAQYHGITISGLTQTMMSSFTLQYTQYQVTWISFSLPDVDEGSNTDYDSSLCKAVHAVKVHLKQDQDRNVASQN